MDTVSYNMLGVDDDGEEQIRGPRGWDWSRAVKGEPRWMEIETNLVLWK